MSISNSQYNAIMREYEKIRSDARWDLQKRKAQVYKKIPYMKELDSRPAALALEKYKSIICRCTTYAVNVLIRALRKGKNAAALRRR